MAKRVRGSSRPGQRRPVDRRQASAAKAQGTTPAKAQGTATTAKPLGLSEAELERAAQLEAEMLAQEKAAEQSRKRTRDRVATRETAGSAPAGSLAAQEAIEYAYVARDVKDIVRVAGILIAILVLLWVVIDVLKLVPIGG